MRIHLLFWPTESSPAIRPWQHGVSEHLPSSLDAARHRIQSVGHSTDAEWLLLWSARRPAPDASTLDALVGSGADVMHAGLDVGYQHLLGSLDYLAADWSVIAADAARRSTSWRLGLDACLIRTQVFRDVGGLDDAFESFEASGLEFGYRCLRSGAMVEHVPELVTAAGNAVVEPPAADLYRFTIRHYQRSWARYLLVRRALSRYPWREWQALAAAESSCAVHAPPLPVRLPVRPWPAATPTIPSGLRVSAIIPTLGRYPYLPAALDSLRRQSVRPFEVIVVDQNPPESRQPSVYEGYIDLGLKVIWQNEQGQSLARNTGLSACSGEFVLMFDDDSVAAPDMIERHLGSLLGDGWDVSTGVSVPPPPQSYELPPLFRYPRVAQTLDTGNCLLPLALALSVGGLDRNYDRGAGTDTDFGTRLYLSGRRILHNPMALRVHHKAPMGGLRMHGAHKYNTDSGLLAPFPPVTLAYYGLRFLSPRQRRERAWLAFLTSKLPAAKRRQGGRIAAAAVVCAAVFLFPLKFWRARGRAQALLDLGVRTMPATPAPLLPRNIHAAAGGSDAITSASRSGDR